MNTHNIPKGLETILSCLRLKLGNCSEAKTRGLFHTPEPPQIGAAWEAGDGSSRDARKTRALGLLSVRSGPGVQRRPPRSRRRAPSRRAATTPGPLGPPPHPQLRSGPPGPDPPAPAPRPAIQPARTPGPHQVDVGEAGEHEVFEELAADAARAHHQDPAPGHGLGQFPRQPPRQCHGGTTTSLGAGGGGRTEPRPEVSGGGAV